jgi:hypothetical protein
MEHEGMTETNRPRLRLIRGGRGELSLGPLLVTVAPAAAAPFQVAATVLEEDTWFILSAEPEVRPPAESTLRIMTDLLQAEPQTPGSVLVGQEEPLQLLAVVYDFAAEQLCRPEWVEAALRGIFAVAEEQKLAVLALPLLGVRHGRFPLACFAELLAKVVRETPLRRLRKLWLQATETEERELRRLLTAMGDETGASQ